MMMIGQKLYAWKIRHFVKFHWKFVCERLVNAVHLHSVSISRIYISKQFFFIWIVIVINHISLVFWKLRYSEWYQICFYYIFYVNQVSLYPKILYLELFCPDEIYFSSSCKLWERVWIVVVSILLMWLDLKSLKYVSNTWFH